MVANIDELCDITNRNGTRAYTIFHLHAALTCLRAGREDNAISWMIRDIGEERGPEEYPQPGTLVDHGDWIEYMPVWKANQGTGGDGI